MCAEGHNDPGGVEAVLSHLEGDADLEVTPSCIWARKAWQRASAFVLD